MICSPARPRDAGAPVLPRALRRDIVVILVVKIAVLAVIAQIFFQPAGSSSLSAEAVTQHLLSAVPESDFDGSR